MIDWFKHIPKKEAEVITAAFDGLSISVAKAGGVVRERSGGGNGSGTRKKIGDESLIADDQAMLAAALKVIPCAQLNYDTWFKHLCALKAACGGDYAFLSEHVQPWCAQYPDNTADSVMQKWESIYDSELGYKFIYESARRYGFKDAVAAAFEKAAAEINLNSDTVEKARHQAERAKLPEIHIHDGDAPRAIDEAERALIAAGGVYQRGSTLVRAVPSKIAVADQRETNGLTLAPVDPALMVDLMTRAARFYRYRNRNWRPTDFPRDLAQMYLGRVGEWKLPMLAGIISAPTLRPDGSILDKPGYDLETRLLFEPEGTAYGPVPAEPTIDNARTAQKVLDELICGFPFFTRADRAVALSTILTACIRRSLPTAPMHAFSAPVAGSGKTLLVDIAASIAEGHQAAVIAPGKNEEELEKRLGSALIAGYGTIAIDNVEQPLGGEQLCIILTQSVGSIRVLGKSKLLQLPLNCLITATGNNLEFRGDMVRRTMLCRLDPGVERPETRKFDSHPLDLIRRDRGRYLIAALTILRAYHVAGRPRKRQSLGSFEMWSDWVRSALIWLGEEDPCSTTEQVRAENPELATLRTIITAWDAAIGNRTTTTKELLTIDYNVTDFNPFDTCQTNPAVALREALEAVCSEHGRPNRKKLGQYLKAVSGRVVDDRRIVSLGLNRDGVQQWRLEKVNATKAAA